MTKAEEHPDLATDITMTKNFQYTVNENCAVQNLYLKQQEASFIFIRPKYFYHEFRLDVIDYMKVRDGFSCTLN